MFHHAAIIIIIIILKHTIKAKLKATIHLTFKKWFSISQIFIPVPFYIFHVLLTKEKSLVFLKT